MLKNKLLMYSNIFIILITANLIFSNGCKKISYRQWVYYDETGCTDPWGVYVNKPESEKIDAIEHYFNEKNIKLFKIEILNDGTIDLCKACFCRTGERIKCKVKKKGRFYNDSGRIL